MKFSDNMKPVEVREPVAALIKGNLTEDFLLFRGESGYGAAIFTDGSGSQRSWGDYQGRVIKYYYPGDTIHITL